VPGTETAIEAASQGNPAWVSILLIVIVISGFGLLGMVVRQLWNDHRELNEFVRDRMIQALERNSDTMEKMMTEWQKKPCMALTPEELRRVQKERHSKTD